MAVTPNARRYCRCRARQARDRDPAAGSRKSHPEVQHLDEKLEQAHEMLA